MVVWGGVGIRKPKAVRDQREDHSTDGTDHVITYILYHSLRRAPVSHKDLLSFLGATTLQDGDRDHKCRILMSHRICNMGGDAVMQCTTFEQS